MAIKTKEGPIGKHSLAFICPVPKGVCKGTSDKSGRYTFHGTPEAVLKCQQHYLQKQGYKKLSRREFQNPKTGAILVLSRKASRHKPGKQDRYMPRLHMKVVW